MTNEGDARDGQENHLQRNIDHLLKNEYFVNQIYGHRLSDERRKEVHKLFVETFEGTKKYHNYTKDMDPEKEAAKRYMLELKAEDYMYVNTKTLEVTDKDDKDALEFVHFYLRG